MPACCFAEILTTYDPSMSLAADNGQFTEVFVECDQNSAFCQSLVDDFIVTWIMRPIAGPDYVMTSCDELFARATPNARIKQQLHVPVS